MYKIIKRTFCILIPSLIFTVFIPSAKAAVIIDHTSVQAFESVPSEYVSLAKSNLRIAYGHTSHGSQIVTGMEMLSAEDNLYSYTTGSDGFLCDGCTAGASDLGNPDRTSWATATREYLDGSGNDRNVIIWSWCGQVSSATESDIADSYLANMARLEQEFPDVTFVYMTGHLDGTGEEGNLKIRNQQIRDYVIANNKVLFDFADIESYSPDGTYYPDESDACAWCTAWCENSECPDCDSCAHSHCFNCYNKGKAFWYMTAVIAGWNGGAPSDDDEDTEGDDGGGGGGCFIATAAYGSPMESHVKILREFRDSYLMPTQWGRGFVDMYYKFSPPLAEFIAGHNLMRVIARWGLAPVVGTAYIALYTSGAQKIAALSVMAILLTGFYLLFRKRQRVKVIRRRF